MSWPKTTKIRRKVAIACQREEVNYLKINFKILLKGEEVQSNKHSSCRG